MDDPPFPGTVPGPRDAAARRRRAVLAGHHGAHDVAAAAGADPDPTVRAAGFGALARLGDLDGRALRRGLTDDDPTVRRRVCELAGQLAGRGRLPGAVQAALVARLDDVDPLVAEAAAWALGELGGRRPPTARRGPALGAGTVAALGTAATGHRDPLVREAAVAALGAVGDPAGLDAVLGALGDRPAVRRRAVAALAAFDDPRAEAAIRRSLEDRDWQVRQAAEDLTDRRG